MVESNIPATTISALQDFNTANGLVGAEAWNFGTNWSNVQTGFETFVNKFLFPKINQTDVATQDLGNRFDFLAKEIDFIGQFSEEYVILDTVPVGMDLSKNAELMLNRNYPNMATKLYGQGIVKKQKFTLNNNDNRLNWATLGDAIKYALQVYKKRISDINLDEERTLKAMLVDYSINQAKEQRSVTSVQDLSEALGVAILNLQNNSDKYNEASKASGGALGRYTTYTPLDDVLILTDDKTKAYILNTQLANTFQIAGLDLTNHIISFDDLGGTFKTTADVTISDDATIAAMNALGDYQVEKGDIIPSGYSFTYDVSKLADFTDKVVEIKPSNSLFAGIFDINAIRYRRYTKGMLKQPFYNGEFDENTYWLHYYTFKSISPFFNKIVLQG